MRACCGLWAWQCARAGGLMTWHAIIATVGLAMHSALGGAWAGPRCWQHILVVMTLKRVAWRNVWGTLTGGIMQHKEGCTCISCARHGGASDSCVVPQGSPILLLLLLPAAYGWHVDPYLAARSHIKF